MLSQIYHTYEEDMHPAYPPLLWLHTPRLRLRVTTVAEDIWVHILKPIKHLFYCMRNNYNFGRASNHRAPDKGRS